MKTIEPYSHTYESLLTSGSRAHLIPTLQRPYTWEKKQISKLWEDIIENPPSYFIGSIVMIANQGSASRDSVIDGQQRLTTMALFLVAIRNTIAGKKGFEEIENDIMYLLSEPRHKSKPRNRIEFSNAKSNKIFSILVSKERMPDSLNDTQKKFLLNYEIILELLHEYSPTLAKKDISELLQKISLTELIYISCSNGSAAYHLFQSINATGVSLASTDLIKNSLFFLMQENKKDLGLVEEKWMVLENQFENEIDLLKTFLRHHWISKGEYTSHASLYEKFERDFVKPKNKKGAEDYIIHAVYSAAVYWALRHHAIDNLDKLPRVRFRRKNIKETLEFLSFLNVDQVYAPLLYLYEKEPDNFEKDLVKLTAFQFLFKYISGSPAEIERLFSSLSSSNPKTKKSKSDVYAKLVKLSEPQKDTFIEKFVEKAKYTEGRSGDIQFILEKYIYNKGPSATFTKPTIEHILPKKPSDKTLKKIKLEGSELTKFLNKVGNLTILEYSENSEDAKDLDFADKVKFYKKSPFSVNKKLEKYGFEENPVVTVGVRGEDIAGDIFDLAFNALKTGDWIKKTEKK